jgi:hypothetical protein
MRVLVAESDRHAADEVVTRLQAAGHQVLRCHEDGLPTFPCNALFDAGSCPLDAPGSVDVVIDHRAHVYPRPTASEDGVACALRHHVPLVASGATPLTPFQDWVTAYVGRDGDVVAACEQAAATRLGRLERPAQDQLDRIVEHGEVEVHRNANRLKATATIPTDAGEIEGAVAVKIAAALRRAAPTASQIDVAVSRQVL